MAEKNPNCYPQCSDDNLVDKLIALNPKIDLTIMDMKLPLQNKSGAFDATLLWKIIKNFRVDSYSESGGNEITIGSSAYGFYSLMQGTAMPGGIYKDIPIFSSPNIQVQNGSGYRNEQSLYTFIQNAWSNSQFQEWFGESGWGGIIENVSSSLVKIAEFAGISPRLGPYFSFQDNPFGNNAQFTCEIKLINDSPQSVIYNNEFLNKITKYSLIKYAGSQKWIPPCLFNVSIKFGDKVIKKLNFCKLSTEVQPVGIIRKESGAPDAYTVRLSFTSLFPETQQTWEGKFQ